MPTALAHSVLSYEAVELFDEEVGHVRGDRRIRILDLHGDHALSRQRDRARVLQPFDRVLNVPNAIALLETELINHCLRDSPASEHAHEKIPVRRKGWNGKPGNLLQQSGRSGEPGNQITVPLPWNDERRSRFVNPWGHDAVGESRKH